MHRPVVRGALGVDEFEAAAGRASIAIYKDHDEGRAEYGGAVAGAEGAAALSAWVLARSLGVDAKTVGSYLDLMVDLLLVRRLEPWHSNSGKRLVKSPRIYVRDSGMVHSLLGLTSMDDVLGHPIAGASWEGFVIEALIAAAPSGTQANFYRTSAGAEIDLLLTIPGRGLWAIEVKRSSAPKVEKGFHQACVDLMPTRRILIYPGQESYPIGHDVEVMALDQAARALQGDQPQG